ncbi:glycosyltransferase [Nonomuraea terrae]|uniref:Glycosyltransferase n=1 Tax=Nonomuraea terrae TaxID=2530383 RepID=A0A4R4Z9D1_9ACTN|nr:glycosyltransferase family 4 protein [Nonomuraea terrae]TDD54586.1 glycosyltransferase [Nonomuraea terrae]
MRILARFHAYPPLHNAGAEWAAHTLLRALAERGHQVQVWLSEVAGREPYELDDVQVLPARTQKDFVEAVRKGAVVVSHLENVRSAASAARGWGRPLVVLAHNTFPGTFKAIGSGTTALAVYNSQWMAQEATKFWAKHPEAVKPEREIVVRPPVHAGDYRATPGELVTLVNLFPNKGADLFWKLAAAMPERKFLAVKGSYGDQDVRDLPNVDVVENVPGTDMAKSVYGRTRVLLMPSEYESWGRVGVEAYASGIPVVAAPTPGLKESLGDAGIFVERDDLDGWRAAVEALDDPDAYKSASAAAKKRSKHLDPATDLARWCEAIEALSGSSARRARG